MKSPTRILESRRYGRFVLSTLRADIGDALDQYVSAIEAEIARPGGQGLFNFDREDLAKRGSTVFELVDAESGRFAAGLHAVVDGGRAQWLQGAIVDPAYRGRGLLRVLAAIARETEDRLGLLGTSCVVRVYPDETVNVPSLRSFVAVGVSPKPGVGRVPLRGDRCDRHLFATAEQDGTIRFLTLAGDESTRGSALRELSEWTKRQ
jgi:GNAT superfamily N-acetyltransferase